MSNNNYSKLEDLLNKIDQGNVLTDEEYEFLKGLNNTISNLDSRYATKNYVDEQIASNQPDIPDVSGLQSKSDQLLETDNKTIVGAINELLDEVNELFQSANNGKQLIADAIGEPLSSNDTFNAMSNDINDLLDTFKINMASKGIDVNNNDRFQSLINKIPDISTGNVTPAGTAVAGDVLSGKTFINSTGGVITGTMTNQGAKTITPTANGQTLPAGYYSGINISGDSDLVSANIVSGKNIFGVTGTATTGSSYEVGTVSKTVTITTTSINISFGKTLDKIPSIISISGNISARSDVNKSSETGTTGHISSSVYYTGAYIDDISKTGCTIYFTLNANSNSSQYVNLQWLAVL